MPSKMRGTWPSPYNMTRHRSRKMPQHPCGPCKNTEGPRTRLVQAAPFIESPGPSPPIMDAGTTSSPGHQIDGGSLADIVVVRSATRWLRLSGIAAHLGAVLAAHVAFQLWIGVTGKA